MLNQRFFHPRIFIAFCFVLLTMVSAVGLVSAEPSEREQKQAEGHFQRGVELHDNGDYRAALIEFKQAYELAPIFHLLYNLGQESAELKDYVQAHKHFIRYLKDGGNQISDERRAAVKRKIARLKKYLATLDFEISEEGAEVAIDGIVIGTSPIDESIPVSVGRRKIVVTLEGHAVWERVMDVAGEEEKLVEVKLISLDSSSTIVVSGGNGKSTAFWISASATGLALVGTGVAVVLTKNAKDNHDAEVQAIGGKTPAEKQLAIDDTAKKYRQMALFTDIGIGLTVVGGITTFLLYGSSPSTSVEESPESASVQVMIAPTQVGLFGRF